MPPPLKGAIARGRRALTKRLSALWLRCGCGYPPLRVGATESDVVNRTLFVQTKRYCLNVLRVQRGKTLLSILERYGGALGAPPTTRGHPRQSYNR